MTALAEAFQRGLAARGLSIKELAEQAGIARPTARDAVEGRSIPRKHVCARLAAALQLDPMVILALREQERLAASGAAPPDGPPREEQAAPPAADPPAQAAPAKSPSAAGLVAQLLEAVPGATIKQLNGVLALVFEETGAQSRLGRFLSKLARARRFLQSESLDREMYADIARGLVERYEEEAGES